MLLVTRDPSICPQCKLLKLKLENQNTITYDVQDADSVDGMATMAYYEVDSVPCLVTDDESVILGVDNIFSVLTDVN